MNMEHSFDVDIAAKYGMAEAVILKHLYYWVQKNALNGENFCNGRYWTFNSIKAFSGIFKYCSERQIRYILKKLKDQGLILIENHSENPYDRRLWYTLTDKGLELFEGQKCQHAFDKNVKSHLTNLSNDNNTLNNNPYLTDVKPDINTQSARTREANLQPIPFTPPAILDRQQRTGKRQPLTVDEQEKATEWFEDFWDVYPKKQGKVEARLAWLRLDYDAELYENIIQAVKRFKAIRRDWQKAGGRYVPMPENFLINERWKDEVAEEPALDFDRPMDLATAGALLEEEWRRQNAAFGKTGGDSGKVQGEIPQLGDYL